MNKREYTKLKKWTDILTDEELKKRVLRRGVRYARQSSGGNV